MLLAELSNSKLGFLELCDPALTLLVLVDITCSPNLGKLGTQPDNLAGNE
jgi:hypothetical protein